MVSRSLNHKEDYGLYYDEGTVHGYFDRAFDEMTDEELETPLANSGLGVKAKPDPNAQLLTSNVQR